MSRIGSTPPTIGRFEIQGQIGRGGMGTLFLAWDPKLDRKVAIKTLVQEDDELRERFGREARSAAGLRHPNIVTIFDVGEHDGHPFIAMEYLQGVTVEALVRDQSSLDLERKIELLEQLCDGLGFAHRAGLVHRDIKPANLMVCSEGPLKILDFGIARSAESTNLTQEGCAIGSLNYMSPEQLQGLPVDLRSDVFSVGLVGYELLSGRKAFPGQLSEGVFHRILHERPPPLSSLSIEIPAELIEIIERAIEKTPVDRYQDLFQMRSDLQRVRERHRAIEAAQTAKLPLDAPPSSSRAAGSVPDSERLPTVARRPESRTPLERERVLRPASPGGQRRSSLRNWSIGIAALAALVLSALWVWSSREKPDEVPDGDRELVTESASEAAASTTVERKEPSGVEPPAPESTAIGASDLTPTSRSRSDRGAQATETSPTCQKLLERISLGETLTESERLELRRSCRG